MSDDFRLREKNFLGEERWIMHSFLPLRTCYGNTVPSSILSFELFTKKETVRCLDKNNELRRASCAVAATYSARVPQHTLRDTITRE